MAGHLRLGDRIAFPEDFVEPAVKPEPITLLSLLSANPRCYFTSSIVGLFAGSPCKQARRRESSDSR